MKHIAITLIINFSNQSNLSINIFMCFFFPLQVLVFSESLVPTVRKALCDPLEEVREAAAKTFEQLHATIGHQALDDILPNLLKQLVRRQDARFNILEML